MFVTKQTATIAYFGLAVLSGALLGYYASGYWNLWVALAVIFAVGFVEQRMRKQYSFPKSYMWASLAIWLGLFWGIQWLLTGFVD